MTALNSMTVVREVLPPVPNWGQATPKWQVEVFYRQWVLGYLRRDVLKTGISEEQFGIFAEDLHKSATIYEMYQAAKKYCLLLENRRILCSSIRSNIKALARYC